MEKIFRILLVVALLPLILSCNIYAPLTGNSSVEDHLEEARKCLHDGDYACAIAEYEKLPEGSLRKQKLCTANLSRMGFTLSSLINTVQEQSSGVLGKLANNLGTWSAEKFASAESAKTQCVGFSEEPGSGDLGVLLKTLGLLGHCANLISKADQIVGVTDNESEVCATAGNKSGTVNAADMTVDGTGSATVSSPAICAKDATACTSDILALNPAALEASKLSGIKGAFDQIPENLKKEGVPVSDVRKALVTTLAR
jgi:hypothetical protein